MVRLKQSWRRPLVLSGVGAGLAAVLVFTNAASLKPEPECFVAQKWAEKNRANLPTTLAALSELAPVYRRAAYNELSVEARKNLWHEHLSGFLTDERLSPKQKEVVSLVISRLDRYMIEDQKAAEALIERDGFTTEGILSDFGALSGEIFAMLGAMPARPAANNVPNGTAVGCDCAVGQPNSCWWAFSSCVNPPTCLSPPGNGCGFLWCSVCNGTCN